MQISRIAAAVALFLLIGCTTEDYGGGTPIPTGGSGGPSTTCTPRLPNYISSVTLLHHRDDQAGLTVFIEPDFFTYPTPSNGTWGREVRTLVDIWSIGLDGHYQPGKTLRPQIVNNSSDAKIHFILWSGTLPCAGAQVGTEVVTGCVQYDLASSTTIQRARVYLRNPSSLNIQIGSVGWVQFFASTQRLILHEMGHAMGIRGHSPNPNDSMFGDGDLAKADGISVADINTLRYAYCPAVTRP